jgi:FKBP-type peptidyl-prolyl cis-trans isomerase (trigger factor)
MNQDPIVVLCQRQGNQGKRGRRDNGQTDQNVPMAKSNPRKQKAADEIKTTIRNQARKQAIDVLVEKYLLEDYLAAHKIEIKDSEIQAL